MKKNILKNIKVIAFDADDTLWVNEPHYRKAEEAFCDLLSDYLPADKVSNEVFKTEMDNIRRYGYGVKAFTLSLIETALRISDNKIPSETTAKILELGKSLLDKPVELLENVDYVLERLKSTYRLVLATKGDLAEQQRKLDVSGLHDYFHHVAIMHDKNENEYLKIIKRMEVNSDEFLMVGNSLKSDILPVLSIGGHAVYVPYHITWQHEIVEDTGSAEFREISRLPELLDIVRIENNYLCSESFAV